MKRVCNGLPTVEGVATGHGRPGWMNRGGGYAECDRGGDANPLKPAQVLEGVLDNIGIESAWDPATVTTYEFFIAAYGLSREGALGAPK